MENIEENNEMIWKIQMKSKLKWFRKYGRKCEMIWKIWKKSKLKCEINWKIQKKIVIR
jgi:hypothetical protein